MRTDHGLRSTAHGLNLNLNLNLNLSLNLIS